MRTKKTILALAIMMGLVSFQALALDCESFLGAPKQSTEAWFACQDDTECVITRGVCGETVTVNKVHRETYDAYVPCEAVKTNCVEPINPPHPRVYCENNKCNWVAE